MYIFILYLATTYSNWSHWSETSTWIYKNDFRPMQGLCFWAVLCKLELKYKIWLHFLCKEFNFSHFWFSIHTCFLTKWTYVFKTFIILIGPCTAPIVFMPKEKQPKTQWSWRCVQSVYRLFSRGLDLKWLLL